MAAKKPAAKRAKPAPRAKKATPPKTSAPVELAKAASAMAKKIKVIRDSFTMPALDYSKLGELKKSLIAAGVHVKKSELLRAGINLLQALPIAKLKTAVGSLAPVKTGRPAGDKQKKDRKRRK